MADYINLSKRICRPNDAGNERLEERFLEERNTLCDDASDGGVVFSTLMRQTKSGQSVAFNAGVAMFVGV
jgi:hypothetical protein